MMQLQGKAQRVIIYIGESDRYEGKPLYMAILRLLKQDGASGATVVRGLAGFGAKSRIHTATIVDLSSDLPIRVEWVDFPEVVERLLPELRRMVDDGLITVEDVNVVQYAAGRRPDPLSQPVQDVMRREVSVVQPDTPVAEVVTLLLQRGVRSLPVVDEDERPVGIITDGDLLRRAGLMARLDLQPELSLADWRRQLSELRLEALTAAELMSSPVKTVAVRAPLREAVRQMTTHQLKRLPVVDEEGRLVGWISRVDILRTMEYHNPVAEGDSMPFPSGKSCAELMYRDVPVVDPDATLEEILQALERNRRRRAVVVDDERRVLGIITDGDLLRRTEEVGRRGLLQRLRNLVGGESDAAPAALPEVTQRARDLMTAPVVTIGVDEPLGVALRLMIEHQIKRLPVVDEEGRLLGLLGRATVLSSLLEDDDGLEQW